MEMFSVCAKGLHGIFYVAANALEIYSLTYSTQTFPCWQVTKDQTLAKESRASTSTSSPQNCHDYAAHIPSHKQ